MHQLTHTVLMIEPVRFGFNADAAETNSFMQAGADLPEEQQAIQERALAEFCAFRELLTKHDIEVVSIQDTPEPHTPDSIFPNNWISTHEDERIVLYPMEPANRRAERRADIVQSVMQRFGHWNTVDLRHFEERELFLEGTGSLVLDRKNQIAYANRSSRMHTEALKEFARQMNFVVIDFSARRANGGQIYHTNVMMSVGETTAVVCAEVITDTGERAAVLDSLRARQQYVVEITETQMNKFAGNMLQLRSKQDEKFWVMSSQAFHALTSEQIILLQHDSSILHAPLDTIEHYGGGSARCMLAEVFVPPALASAPE